MFELFNTNESVFPSSIVLHENVKYRIRDAELVGWNEFIRSQKNGISIVEQFFVKIKSVYDGLIFPISQLSTPNSTYNKIKEKCNIKRMENFSFTILFNKFLFTCKVCCKIKLYVFLLFSEEQSWAHSA